MKKIVCIVGPTGVGKSDISLELAKKYGNEIINGDSVQVYKKLNIGSVRYSSIAGLGKNQAKIMSIAFMMINLPIRAAIIVMNKVLCCRKRFLTEA